MRRRGLAHTAPHGTVKSASITICIRGSGSGTCKGQVLPQVGPGAVWAGARGPSGPAGKTTLSLSGDVALVPHVALEQGMASACSRQQ
jgi:hypothetical protein